MTTAEARELQELELQSPDDKRVEGGRHQVAKMESSEPRVRLSKTENESGKRTGAIESGEDGGKSKCA